MSAFLKKNSSVIYLFILSRSLGPDESLSWKHFETFMEKNRIAVSQHVIKSQARFFLQKVVFLVVNFDAKRTKRRPLFEKSNYIYANHASHVYIKIFISYPHDISRYFFLNLNVTDLLTTWNVSDCCSTKISKRRLTAL